jgi:hypothetical protein
VALAVSKAFPRYDTEVGHGAVVLFLPDGEEKYIFLPPEIYERMSTYYRTGIMKPFSFTLTLFSGGDHVRKVVKKT